MALTKIPGFAIDNSSGFTFSTANVTGNLTSGNSNLGNLATANYFSGNGSLLTGIVSSSSNTAATVTTNAQPNITSVGTLTTLNVSGNVSSGGNVIGNGQYLSNITGGNVTGQVGNALIAGTVYANAQPNITSVGTLTSLTSGLITATSGGIKVGNIQDPSGTNTIVTSNITAGGGGTGTVTGTYLTGTLTTGAQPNITSTGTLQSTTIAANSNITMSGSLSRITGGNLVSATYLTGTLTTGSQPNITSTGTLTTLTVSGNSSITNVSITGDIIPTVANTYNLGNANYYFKSVYIGPGSLYVDGSKVLQSVSNVIVFSADTNQNLRVTTAGTGDIEMLPSGTGSIAVKGPLQIQSGKSITSSDGGAISVANPISVDSIQSRSANTDLIISSNGTGVVKLDDDVTITGNLILSGTAANISVTNLTVQDNLVDINAETTGTPSQNAGIRVIRGDQPSVQLRWLESGSSGKWQISNDGSTYLDIVGQDSSSNVSVTNLVVSSNVSAGNLKTDNLLYSNGVAWTFSSYSNTQVGAYLPTYSGLVGGTLSTASQPNITSVGTLTSLSSGLITATSGGIKVGNIQDPSGTNTIQLASGSITVTGGITAGGGGSGNVTATYFIGNGSQLTGLPASYSNTNAAAYLPTYSGLVGGTLSTASQPNITSVGSLASLTISGDATITGNLTISGSYNYVNVSTLNIKDPVIELGGNPNGTALTTNDGYDRGTLLHYYTTAPVDAFMGWKNSGSEFIFASNASLSANVVTVNNYGNVHAGYYIGNGSALSSLTGANVTGYVPTATAANTAGTVTTGAQPNITSTGTLVSLTSGLITATSGGVKVGNIIDPSGTNTIQLASGSITVTGGITAGGGGSGNVTATYFIGNGSQLTGITSSYSNTNVGAYLPTYTGNVSAGNVLTNNLLYANGTAYSLGSGLTFTANTTPPATGNIAGDQWFDISANILYEYLNDGTSNYWVDTTSSAISSTGSSGGGTSNARAVGYSLVFGG